MEVVMKVIPLNLTHTAEGLKPFVSELIIISKDNNELLRAQNNKLDNLISALEKINSMMPNASPLDS